MRRLVELCLRTRWLVVVAALALLCAGALAARDAPIDAFPEFAPPLVEVQTEAPGLSSLEVENLVTTPIERVLAGASFATTIRSKSVLGLSSVVVLFQPGTDLLVARQVIQERLTRAQALLPATARAPSMLAPVSSTSRVLKVGLTSSTLSQADLTDLVRWSLRPALLAIPGVADVAVWGARAREYSVHMDPARMDAANVSVDELTRALQGATQPLPGGYIDGPLQRMPVQHTAAIERAEDIAALPVAARGGAPLRVGDVADVADSYPPPIGDAVVNDQPGLLLIVVKQPWGNTLEITRRADEVIKKLKPALQGVEVDAAIFRPAAFIERSIGNLEHALLLGCGLVVGVLLLFLWNLRTALISALAIPLSLAAAVLVLRALDITLNTMTLAGLVIALGEVVDDAIIDVENCLRRLRENSALPEPRAAFRVVLDASIEVRGAVVCATLIVVLVFLPVWFLEGVSGAFFRPLALAYAVGVLASMVVALSVTPALCLIALPRALHRHKPSPVLSWVERHYLRTLQTLLSWPRLVLASAAVLLVCAVLGLLGLRSAFLPEFRENDFLMHWVAQPGTSLAELQRSTLRISRELRAIPGVHSFGAHLGRAEAGDEVVGPNFAELWVHADSDHDHAETSARLRAAIEHYPGLRRDLETYLRERVEEVVSGAHGAIVVRLFGPELTALRQGADLVAERVRALSGVANVQVEQQALVPEVRVSIRPEAAALGFLAGDVRRAITLLLNGQPVGELIRDGRSIPVVLRGPDALRQDISSLCDTAWVSATGARARLCDVAEINIGATPNSVPHEAGSRRIDVSISVHGEADLGVVMAQVQQVVGDLPLPAAHYAQVLGEWSERQAAVRRLLLLSCLSLALVLVVLYLDLESWRATLLIATSLPFALVGGVAGAWLGGGVLSLGSLVGLVTVLGIAARNGILLIGHYRNLEATGATFDRELVLRGSSERLGPILMTALATALALVPLVLAGDLPGHEIEHPMAVVILGGLASSTCMNLAVLPVLHLWVRARELRTQGMAAGLPALNTNSS